MRIMSFRLSPVTRVLAILYGVFGLAYVPTLLLIVCEANRLAHWDRRAARLSKSQSSGLRRQPAFSATASKLPSPPLRRSSSRKTANLLWAR
jgi:hypothetical protein